MGGGHEETLDFSLTNYNAFLAALCITLLSIFLMFGIPGSDPDNLPDITIHLHPSLYFKFSQKTFRIRIMFPLSYIISMTGRWHHASNDIRDVRGRLPLTIDSTYLHTSSLLVLLSRLCPSPSFFLSFFSSNLASFSLTSIDVLLYLIYPIFRH